MKLIYLIVTVIALVGRSVFGQITTPLDKANGFRAFTIDKELSQVKESLEFMKVIDHDEVKLYKVKDPTSFNGKNGIAELVFYKDKLAEITIFFRKTSIKDYYTMRDSLTKHFGAPVDDSNSKTKATHLSKNDKVYTWKGTKVGLQLNYEVNNKMIEMIYWGLNEVTEKIKEEL
jgi:hypothetical protein